MKISPTKKWWITKKTRDLQNLANLHFLFKYHRLVNPYNGPNKNVDMANTRDAPTRGETIQVPSHNPKLISLHQALLAIQISWWLHPVEWGGIGGAPKFHHFHTSNSHGASIIFEVSKDISSFEPTQSIAKLLSQQLGLPAAKGAGPNLARPGCGPRLGSVFLLEMPWKPDKCSWDLRLRSETQSLFLVYLEFVDLFSRSFKLLHH